MLLADHLRQGVATHRYVGGGEVVRREGTRPRIRDGRELIGISDKDQLAPEVPL